VLNLVAIVLSGGSLVVAYVALRRAQSAERRALAEATTHAFLAFRARFQPIKRDLPPRWSDKEWIPEPDTDEWRRIELYWQNAFDERFVPMRLNQGAPGGGLAVVLRINSEVGPSQSASPLRRLAPV
jgi:hypothetical protein